MIALFQLPREKQKQVEQLVMKNDILSRQSIVFRESVSLGLKGSDYYLEINGSEEAIQLAKETLKDFAKEVTGQEKDRILEIVRKQEEAADAGFGAIFG